MIQRLFKICASGQCYSRLPACW